MEYNFKEGDLVVRVNNFRNFNKTVLKIINIHLKVFETFDKDLNKVKTKDVVLELKDGMNNTFCKSYRNFRLATDLEISNSYFSPYPPPPKLTNIKSINKTIDLQVHKQVRIKINNKFRDLTLVVLILDGQFRAGYSIKNPEDRSNEDLAIIIAKGRALSDKTNLLDMYVGIGMDKKFILYAIADHLIKKINYGSIKIKGVK